MRRPNFTSILILILGMFTLLIIGILMEIFGYNSQLFDLIKNHDVINVLIYKTNRVTVLIFFSITMIMEELIFRYYSIGVFNSLLNLDYYLTILISSTAFSLYHIHIWFSFKNVKLLFINLIYPFLMDLYLGYIIFVFGFISCIIAHYILAFFMHYSLYRRFSKNNFENKIKKKY